LGGQSSLREGTYEQPHVPSSVSGDPLDEAELPDPELSLEVPSSEEPHPAASKAQITIPK
jgi:hypothetical protein